MAHNINIYSGVDIYDAAIYRFMLRICVHFMNIYIYVPKMGECDQRRKLDGTRFECIDFECFFFQIILGYVFYSLFVFFFILLTQQSKPHNNCQPSVYNSSPVVYSECPLLRFQSLLYKALFAWVTHIRTV